MNLYFFAMEIDKWMQKPKKYKKNVDVFHRRAAAEWGGKTLFYALKHLSFSFFFLYKILLFYA